MSERAFVGMFAHLNPQAPGEAMLLTIALPRGEHGAVVMGLGAPDPELGPMVALLPCLRPQHPRSDDDAVLLAALRVVNHRLEGGIVRFTPEILHEIGALDTLLPRPGRRRNITAPSPAIEGAR